MKSIDNYQIIALLNHQSLPQTRHLASSVGTFRYKEEASLANSFRNRTQSIRVIFVIFVFNDNLRRTYTYE